jgi:CHAT domain-containing protein
MIAKLNFDYTPSYVGNRATVASFIKECDKASILHIAVHYKIDPDPSKFTLQLAADGDSDGEITVQELADITNPHLQLVVLSACESAASTDPLQSGPSCAAEVFSLAGAKSVLGGLWKVSDAAASKLMVDFYRTLSRGKTRTEALQRAQIEALAGKDYAHPFYWACFALYGNPW